jgi:hypothetical protein
MVDRVLVQHIRLVLFHSNKILNELFYFNHVTTDDYRRIKRKHLFCFMNKKKRIIIFSLKQRREKSDRDRKSLLNLLFIFKKKSSIFNEKHLECLNSCYNNINV